MFRLLGGVLIILLMSVPAGAGEDVVHLLQGGSVKGAIVEIDDAKLKLRVSLAGGAGSSVRTLQMARVKAIDFAPLPSEAALLAAGDSAPKQALTDLWANKRQHLGRPNSNAGQVGMLLGEVLMDSVETADHANARNLYSIIESGDWDAARRAAAKRGRLNALVRLGAAVDVLAEAKEIADQSDDPELLLDAKHALAMAEYRKLARLVDDNPKWAEDDRVGPKVEALYHDLLDRFLYPFLFYGTESEAAARGLWNAGETYRLIEQPERAKECYSDLKKLYPTAAQHYGIEAAIRKTTSDNHESTDTEN
jgi:hypothetical protein